MNDLVLIRPVDKEMQESGRLSDILKAALKNRYYDVISSAGELGAWRVRPEWPVRQFSAEKAR